MDIQMYRFIIVYLMGWWLWWASHPNIVLTHSTQRYQNIKYAKYVVKLIISYSFNVKTDTKYI